MNAQHTPTPWTDSDWQVTGPAAADAYIAHTAIEEGLYADSVLSRSRGRGECAVRIAQIKELGKAAVATVHGDTPEIARANAAHIVKCVNAHDALVKVARACAAFFSETDAPMGIAARAALAAAGEVA